MYCCVPILREARCILPIDQAGQPRVLEAISWKSSFLSQAFLRAFSFKLQPATVQHPSKTSKWSIQNLAHLEWRHHHSYTYQSDIANSDRPASMLISSEIVTSSRNAEHHSSIVSSLSTLFSLSSHCRCFHDCCAAVNHLWTLAQQLTYKCF